MKQIIYTPDNPPPTKGIGKKIWAVLVREGLEPEELHFNPGRRSVEGSGTWACTIQNTKGYSRGDRDVRTGTQDGEYWCGLHGKTAVYLEGMVAPYNTILVGFTTRVCPFRYSKHSCKYPSMTPSTENIWPEGCPKDKNFHCDSGTDEFLILRNNEYEKWKR